MVRGSLLFIGAGAGAVSIPGERDVSGYTFSAYTAEFAKTYSDGERDFRKTAFEANLKLIQEHNSDDEKSWFAGVNKFTDMTKEEFRNHVKGNSDIASSATSNQQWAQAVSLQDLPERVDWREENVVSDIKDQGGCGSCWAFSAAETFESHLAIATGEAVQELSPQQIVSCAPNLQHCGGQGGCKGSTQPLAFNYTQFAGLTTEANYAYRQLTGVCDHTKIDPVAFNTGGYVKLPVNDYTALMTAVATKGPIAISVAATSMQLYGGGILGGCNDYVMNHAVQLVGYGTDEGFGKDYWLVRNSWGQWGEDGYIRLQRHGEGQEPCGVDKSPADGDACDGDKGKPTLCGECAILSASSYPVGMSKVAPPTPPTPPAPTPTTHYGKPPCNDDESQVILADEGSVCAAQCETDTDCPTDKPAGVWKAKPACILFGGADQSKPSLCALRCRGAFGCGKGQTCYSFSGPDQSAIFACGYSGSGEASAMLTV